LAGIYLHIPFCKQACTYCNFHFSTNLSRKADFLTALSKEIVQQNDFISKDESIETIYFGGGTPSLLTELELQQIISLLYDNFKVAKNVEITLEANPDDINPTILKTWLSLGINRLSLGVQSFSDDELVWMNRAHNANQSIESIKQIIEAGFENFSVDLIFGSPFLSNETLLQSIQILSELEVPHLSCYALTVEEKTALYHSIKKKKSPEIKSEKQAEQFLLCAERLTQLGYEHYEISNYAKPGKRSKHNSSYWKGMPYYGFGPSAHAFNGKNIRKWNISDNILYNQRVLNNENCFEIETLTETQLINEFIMTSIRTAEGFTIQGLRCKFGDDVAKQIEVKIKDLKVTNYFQENDGNQIVLSPLGKLYADGITAELFF
jgi:oxygen-independent coproporphyrinogen-3 oxidase